MNLAQLKEQYIQELKDLYETREIESLFEMVIEEILQLHRMEISFKKKEPIEEDDENECILILEALKTKQPIQHILGHAWFCGRKFKVNQDVLIPRPETEELVHWIIQSVNKTNQIELLDIGTGSGCIPISLQLALPNASINAIDISTKSLSIAKENAILHSSKIQFDQMDILATELLDKNYDVIVSNPPYIPEKEKSAMHGNVLEYEPHLALFVPDEDPLVFYRKITLLASKHLHQNGLLFFEIHYDQAGALQKIIRSLGFEVEIRKDIYGQDRMIKARKIS